MTIKLKSLKDFVLEYQNRYEVQDIILAIESVLEKAITTNLNKEFKSRKIDNEFSLSRKAVTTSNGVEFFVDTPSDKVYFEMQIVAK